MTTIVKPAAAEMGLQTHGLAVTTRPRFNSHRTSDRLRESSNFHSPPFMMKTNIKKGRMSVFKEVGLDEVAPLPSSIEISPSRQTQQEHGAIHTREERLHNFGSESKTSLLDEREIHQIDDDDNDDDRDGRNDGSETREEPRRPRQFSFPALYNKITSSKGRPRIKTTSAVPSGPVGGLQRFAMLVLLIAVVLPAFGWRNGKETVEMSGADAGMIRPREVSPTKVCTRWALQSALLNGTLYMYGGRAKTEGDQKNNTWNNNFLTLDLTRNWDAGDPALTGLERPDGPPEVSMGYLWHDYNNLFVYGGQFSDSPYVEPGPASLWKYSIKDKTWSEIANPITAAGNESEPENQPVQRAAEGAGISVPELGLSWYFGGHLDWATTQGWSQQIDRVYLKSLLEFTHPGYTNTGLQSLARGVGTGADGAFRNITRAGIQDGKFPERADGVLVYVPGWGDMGVLIGLAGGTEDTFTDDLGTLDVYDIANSKWFHQETSGERPSVRVNPCAVVASAPDASSFQIYVFGGQNLPFGEQEQYNDMYILSIPSFTWIKVDQSGQNVPHARAGHTCVLYDGQMVVVGGYVGENVDCDPGMYIFDASRLQWQTSFKAGDHPPDHHPDNGVLAGSYGYRVPRAVQQVIGGGESGKATATTPAQGGATGGPFATGKPPVFTVTEPGATATVAPDDHNNDNSNQNEPDKDDKGHDSQPGLVAAGAIAGVAGLLAVYLGFCAWLYRRQVRAYKRHVAAANRYSGASAGSLDPSSSSYTAPAAVFGSARPDRPSRESDFSWVAPDRRPQWLQEPKSSEDPSSLGSSGSGGVARRSEETGYRPATSASWSGESTEGLLGGNEPSFFNVVLGPRQALRVVNAVESP